MAIATDVLQMAMGPFGWAGADELLDVIAQHPILMNRPLVVTPLGTRLCRPSEAVLELLPVPKLPPFVKEDGGSVVDTGVRRKPAV